MMSGGESERVEPEEDERANGPREPMDSGGSAVIAGEALGAALGGCDGGCGALQLSLLLSTAAVLAPPRSGRPVAMLIRVYRRALSRFTPACPATPSCSSYALTAVTTLGPRRGLSAAAHRVHACGKRHHDGHATPTPRPAQLPPIG